MNTKRCAWAVSDPLTIHYHDTEWGVPLHNDRQLFEMLLLEGAQAGLNWTTILKRRQSYRKAFSGFDPHRVARYGLTTVKALLVNKGIVRNRLKIQSAIKNAQAFLAIQHEFGSFDRYVWQFVGSTPKVNARKSIREIPAHTPESDVMSKDLKKRGFTFVGPTICYAFMQAVGMVNDHTIDCFRYPTLKQCT